MKVFTIVHGSFLFLRAAPVPISIFCTTVHCRVTEPKGHKRVVFMAFFHYHENIDVFAYRQEANDHGRFDK